ncbi:MAG: phosphoenolpyruvate--protein phosphotransferase [Chitinispirillaceae bacterium]
MHNGSRNKGSVRKLYSGVPLVGGAGYGPAYLYKDVLSRETETWEIRDEEVKSESSRIFRVIEEVKRDLENLDLAHLNLQEESDIFNVHRSILDDPWLFSLIESELENRKLNAESIVRLVFSFLGQRFRSSQNPTVSDKAHDLEDIEHRILTTMTGAGDNPLGQMEENRVVFARRLLPSDTLYFSKKKPAALVTKEGGPGSHAALIARSLEIPFISNVEVTDEDVGNGTEVVVDADRSVIIVNPTEEEKRNALNRTSTIHKNSSVILEHSRRHNKTVRSFENFSVMANVNVKEDVRAAVEHDCDGVGLYRTENIYMLASNLPDQSYLYNELSESFEILGKHPAIVRLADLGGDKTLQYLNVGAEHSSQLGVRGVRFLLMYRNFLRLQLRVFCMLSKIHHIRILIPFVSDAHDVIQVRNELDEVCSFLGISEADQPDLGAMIETPLAVMNAESILEHSDFISMGTNDLQQFVAAADRESLMVSHYFQEAAPKVIELASDIARLCGTEGKDCFVCGEIAGNKEYLPSLLRAGVRNFSVLPARIPEIKETAYHILVKLGKVPNRDEI